MDLAHLKFEGRFKTTRQRILLSYMDFCFVGKKQLSSNSQCLSHFTLLSLFLCPLSFSVSVCLSPCVVVCCCVLVWCVRVVVCLCVLSCVWRGLARRRKPPCVDSKRSRVYRHHAHMCCHMRAWCRHTRGRFERTHGGVLDGHTVDGRCEEGEVRRSPSVLLTEICT